MKMLPPNAVLPESMLALHRQAEDFGMNEQLAGDRVEEIARMDAPRVLIPCGEY